MAVLTCGATMAKYILFVFNFVLFVAGAAILGVSIWMRVDPNFSNYIKVISVSMNNPVIDGANIVLIIVGSILFLVGGLGCAGACCENACMLGAYCTFLGLIILLQLVGGILAAVFMNQIGESLRKSMVEQTKERYNGTKHPNSTDVLTKAWDGMQMSLKCCGGNSYRDYNESKFRKDQSPYLYSVPLTCCKQLKDAKPEVPKPVNQTICLAEGQDVNLPNTYPFEALYHEGCYPSLTNWLKHRAGILIGIAFGIVAVEIIGIVTANCIRRQILDQSV